MTAATVTALYREGTVTALAPEGDGRTLLAMLVPWEVPARVDDGRGPYREAFGRGSLAPERELVPVFEWHDPDTGTRGPLIGRVDQLDDRDDGLYGALRIADTGAGRDLLALYAERVVTGVSIEFVPTDDPDAGPDGVVRRTAATLLGVAMTHRPAHPTARVLAQRSERAPAMTDPYPLTADPDAPEVEPEVEPEAPDPEEARARAASTRVNALVRSTPRAVAPARERAPRFRSFGHFAQAAASGQLAAAERERYWRALGDVTTEDVGGLLPERWLTEIADLIVAERPFVQAFTTRPLPDSGMTINFPTVPVRPAVGLQTAEKTAITSTPGSIGASSTTVQTWAGGEDISVQVLQRTDPSYLSLAMSLYAEQMAMTTDLAAITAAETAIGAGRTLDIASTAAGLNLALAGAAADILTAAKKLPEVLVVGANWWEFLAGAADSEGRPLFPNLNGSNPVGTLSFSDTSGQVRGLSFAVSPNLDPDHAILGWRRGFVSMLGAVQTMTADNPTLLGRDYAVFQFGAFIPWRPDAMRILNLTAAI